MSQENPTVDKSNETRKKILLSVLFVVFLGVIYYQFFSGGDEAEVTRPVAASNVTQPTPAPRATPRVGGTPEPIISQPLDLASMISRSVSGEGVGRNIFTYPPPPPPPTPKPQPTVPPPPPPPVTLFSVKPAGVLARTGEFNLIIYGEKIPQDAKIYFDGREYVTAFVSAKEVKAIIPADAIRNPGNLGVMVRSISDTTLFSNQLTLNVAEPPAPPYRFIGLIVRKSGTMAVLKSQTEDEVINVVKDQQFKNWKVISISPQKIVIEDTSIKVSHTISYSGENG